MREPQRATINYVIGVNEYSQQCRVFKGVGYRSLQLQNNHLYQLSHPDHFTR